MKLIVIIATAVLSLSSAVAQQSKTMTHTLKPLPYSINALEPNMSAETLEYHWGKHLATYISNLNGLIVDTEFANSSLEDIVRGATGAIFNNGAQALNHEIFFESFSPTPQSHPTGKLLKAIDNQFGSFDKFKEQFTKSSIGLFGAGWNWLAVDSNGALQIVSESNAGNPLTKGLTPLLGVDVWEHSYYIDFRNRRADYLTAFWNIVDWKVIDARYDEATK